MPELLVKREGLQLLIHAKLLMNNQAIKKIHIIPNSGIYFKGGKFFLIDTIESFLFELKNKTKSNIELSAISLDFSKNHFLKEITNDRLKINICFIGNKSRVVTAFDYMSYFIKSGFKIFKEKKVIYYIFIPGNISLITAFWLVLFGRKYGLYVRGDIRSEGFVKHLFYKALIWNADFCLVTGTSFHNEVLKISKKSESVSPMIKYSSKDLCRSTATKCSNEKFRFLYISRVSRDKGVFDLIMAFKELRKSIYFTELLIIGNMAITDNKDLEVFNKTIAEEGISYLGAIADAEKLKLEYTNSDCFVLASHHEGFPRVLYEAMIFGLPIITTDLPGLKKDMIHGKNCLKYPVRDQKALANTMLKMMNDSMLRSKLSNAGFNFMLDFFDKKKESHAHQVIRYIDNF